MSLRIRLAPFTRTGIKLVDLALRSVQEGLSSIVDQVRHEVIIRNVVIANGGHTQVPHGLGYAYSHISVSPVRGASSSGRIEDITAQADAKTHIDLEATGFGATVTVDLRIT